MTRALRSYVVEQEDQQAELIDILRINGGPHALHLADKLTRCRQSRERMRAWGGRPLDLRAVLGKDSRYRCEHHACWSCRRKRIRDVASKWAMRFGEADNEFSSHVTVADSTTGDLGEVRHRVASIARGLRDRRDAAAETWARWCTVEAVGHIELDPYWWDDICNLAPDQHALIPTLPVLTHVMDGPMWVVRAHLAIRHDDIGRDELEEVLGRQWPGADRVHVVPFYEHQPAWENAGDVLSYSIKHLQHTNVGLMSDRWPVAWQATYWTWIHQMGRGLQPLRVSVGPQRAKSRIESLLATASRRNRLGDDEPMPVVIG